MSDNPNYVPRHGAPVPIDPVSEPLVAQDDGAEAAFASLVSDALHDRQAAREAADRDAAEAVASLDVVDDDPAIGGVATGARTTLLEGRNRQGAQAASRQDGSALLHEARTTLMDGRQQAPKAAATAQGEARTTLLDGRDGARRVSPGTTAPQQVQAPSRGDTFVAAPTVRRTPVAAARPAVPSQPYDSDDERYDRRPSRRGDGRGSGASRAGRALSSAIIGFLALVPRVAAIALCALVVLCALPMTMSRLIVINICNIADALVPEALAGVLVYQTPFGGAFRGDYAVLALIFFIIDWLLVKVAFAIWGSEDD